MPRKKRSNRNPGRRKRGRDIGLFVLWGMAAVSVLAVYFLYDLPDIDKVKPLDSRHSIVIQANDGTLIARYGGMQGDVVEMKDVSQHMIAALLAVEDRRFYHHFGIDPQGLARAMLANALAGGWVQGGSTITQQLAKNMFLTPDKTLRRKVQEAIMALRIERKLSKDEIMLAYLNRVYFGAGAYGVDAAAKTYFSKSAAQLTLFESALLAGLLKAPTRFSPATNPDLALARTKVVIEAMKDAGYIGAERAAREIANGRVNVARSMAGDLNRYFSDWVVDQVDGFVATAESDIFVRTTLDPKLQLMAEAKAKALFRKVAPEDAVSQMALVTEARDGAVLAMIGGQDYKASQFNRATQALRQPGSAFKPFVYLAALEAGFDPDTKVEDAPMREGAYRPDNYDRKYFGTVTLTEALAHSMNTATVRLLQLVGVDRLLDVAARAGFEHLPKPELAAGLGTGEVTLLEITSAYAALANGGRTVWPYAILSIRDEDGNLLYQREPAEDTEAFSSRDIGRLDGMLVQAVAGGTGQAAQLSRGHVAGKTGTTQNYRDAWFVGYTEALVTGIWMGNDDNAPMRGVTGGKYPAQLWRSYMNEAIKFDVPEYGGGSGGFFDMLNTWSGRGRGKPAYN